MRQSQLFTRALKTLPKDESSYNAQVLLRAGFIDKTGAGIYSWLPLGLKVINKISNIVREEMTALGGQEILMSALSVKSTWQKTGRWDNFDALFKLTGSDQREYALGATHEEIVTPLMKKFIFSYRELPVAVFQIQTKFRNEKRAKAGLLRGREFLMKDMYSFHSNQADLDSYYEKTKEAYLKIYERLGLGQKTYLTYAAGGTFSRFSHEFQTICSSGEDNIFICQPCSMAINQEIIKEQTTCPACGLSNFKKEKAIEVGNIFKLGTRYSSPFDLNYIDQSAKIQPVIMGCYGLGLSRVLGAIVECSHDQRGIIWPSTVSPFTVHLLDLGAKEAAEKIYQQLLAAGLEVLYDDRHKIQAGEKFAEADLIGCPWRLIISPKTLTEDKLEIKERPAKTSRLLTWPEIFSLLK